MMYVDFVSHVVHVHALVCPQLELELLESSQVQSAANREGPR